MITRSTLTLTSPTGGTMRATSCTLSLSDDRAPYLLARVSVPAALAGDFAQYDPRSTVPPTVLLEVARHGGTDGNSCAAQTAAARVGGKVKASKLTQLGANKARHFTSLSTPFNATHIDGQHLAGGFVVDAAKHDMKRVEYVLSLTGRELLLQDYAPTGDATLAATTLGALVSQILLRAGQSPALGETSFQECGLPEWKPTQSAWAVVEALLDDRGYRLIFDLDGRWHIVSRKHRYVIDSTTQIPVLDVAELIGATRSLSRDPWADRVDIVATHKDANGVVTAFRSSAGANPHAKGVYLDRGENPPSTEATTAAELLARYRARGDSITLTLPLDLDYQPLTFIDFNATRYLIATVEHDFTDHTTTLTTREGA